MKAEIVRFKDDTYGIRYTNPWYEFFVAKYEFQDFSSSQYRWPADSKYFKNCKTTLEEATKLFETMNDVGEPI